MLRGTSLMVACWLAAGCGESSTATPDAADAALPVVTVGFAEATSHVDETSGTVQIRVVLSEPAENFITTTFHVVGGTATKDEDYTVAEGELTFRPGSVERTIDLTILPDAITEPDESILLTFSTWSGADLGIGTHAVTIDANLLPRVSFATPSSSADENGTTSVDVVLDTPSPFPITVDYTLAGTTTSADYTLVAGTLTFPANSTAPQPLVLGEHVDGLDEDDETVVIALANPSNAVIGAVDTHTHTIVDIDAAPTVAITTTATSMTESNVTVMLSVDLSAASGKTVTVMFGPGASSTASSPSDYSYATAAPLVFSPGTTTQTIAIDVVNDLADEITESLVTNLTSAINATLGAPASHTLTIADNELTCFGTGNSQVCLDLPPSGTVSLSGAIATNADARCLSAQPVGWIAAGQPDSCFIAGASLTVGSFAVRGTRPLVLVGDSITVSGTLDASSHRGGTTGPASPSTACAPFAGSPVGGATGGGGAAGGSFQSIGGTGGKANGGSVIGGVAAPADAAAPGVLRAGCNGQVGGNGGAGNVAGAIGRGGGAIYLVAGTTLTISGAIDASGSAGSGGAVKTGGSGAGSGGMIKLFAPSISANGARLVANGGGGASGAQNSGGGSGFDPDPTMPLVRALGGTGEGGAGGAGYAGGVDASSGLAGAANQGGGGGGGGGGYVQSNLPLTGATVSAGRIDAP